MRRHIVVLAVCSLIVAGTSPLMGRRTDAARVQLCAEHRAWLPGELALRHTVVAATHGALHPLLWPGDDFFPRVFTRVRLLVPIHLPARPGTTGSFLVDYRSADGRTLVQFGAYPFVPPHRSSVQPVDVRNLPARLAHVSGPAAGKLWLWWQEPGRWQPLGAGHSVLTAVTYVVHARGLTEAGVRDIAENLSPPAGAWAYVRDRLPSNIPVVQPAWVPARFCIAPATGQSAMNVPSLGGPYYHVGYRSPTGDSLLFILGTANSGRVSTETRIPVRGTSGWLMTGPDWPAIAVDWREQGRFYFIQARGVTRAEMLRIAASLAPVTAAS